MRIIFLISLVFGDHYFIAPTENFYHYTYHLCPQNHCLFFALLSHHDAFGIMIFHQRNGKWFLRPKQRGLNSVDLFIKEPLFLLLTTADCAEETEKSRSRQRWAKTTTFQKYELINLPFGLFIFYCRVFFTVPPNFPVPKWKTRGTLKKIDVKDLLVGWRVFLVMYRKYWGTAKKHPVKCYGQNLKKCQCRASNTPMFGFRLFVLNVEYIHFH